MNMIPIATDDTGLELLENKEFRILISDLLQNDYDPDGDPIELASVQGAEGGQVYIDTVTGEVVFTPDANYAGPASFQYTISDGNDGENTALVSMVIRAVAESEDVDYVSGSEIQVNTSTNSGQSPGSISTFDNGDYIVTWTSFHNQTGSVYAQRFDATGSKIGTELKLNSLDGYLGDPNVATYSDGSFVAVWDDGATDVYARKFDANGNPLGDEILIEDGIISYVPNPDVVALEDGGFAVAWKKTDTSTSGLSIQVFDAEGAAIGAEHLFYDPNEEPRTFELKSLSDGNLILVWDAVTNYSPYEDSIFFQKLDNNGSLIGDRQQIPEGGNSSSPKISTLEDGGYVVIWTTADSITGQRYDVEGNAVGNNFVFSGVPEGVSYDRPEVTSLPDGGFMITWEVLNQVTYFDEAGFPYFVIEDVEGLPDPSGVYGQRFDSNNDTVGDVFIINDYIDDRQSMPLIATLANGDFVVTWRSEGQDGSGGGVFSKIISQEIPIEGAVFTGTDSVDVIEGTAGDDIISGERGDDNLNGGDGHDVFLIEGTKDDVDDIDGGAGYDVIQGQQGNDRFYVTSDLGNWSSIEEVSGGSGYDSIRATNSADVLDFSDGPILSDIEEIRGRRGDDIITGSSNSETVKGGGGSDILDGHLGDDYVIGGSGNDTFVIKMDSGNDTLGDFGRGSDLIDVTDYDFIDLEEVMSHATQVNNDVVFNFADGTSLTIEDTQLNELNETSFLIL